MTFTGTYIMFHVFITVCRKQTIVLKHTCTSAWQPISPSTSTLVNIYLHWFEGTKMYYSSHFLTIDSHSKCISLNEYSKVSFIPGHSINNVLLYSCLGVLLYFCINKQNVAIRPWINVSISLVSFMSKLVLRENSSWAAMSPDFWIQRIFLEKDFLKIQWIHFRPLNKIWKVPTHSILLCYFVIGLAPFSGHQTEVKSFMMHPSTSHQMSHRRGHHTHSSLNCGFRLAIQQLHSAFQSSTFTVYKFEGSERLDAYLQALIAKLNFNEEFAPDDT